MTFVRVAFRPPRSWRAVVAGLAGAAVVACDESMAPPISLEERTGGVLALGTASHLRVANGLGPVLVEGESVGPVARWSLDKHVTAPTVVEARTALDALAFDGVVAGDSASAQIVPPPISTTVIAEAVLSLGIPAATRCVVDSVVGEASVRYLSADVSVLDGSPVSVLDHTGNVLVGAEGAVTIRAVLPLAGACVVSTTEGDIDVAVPEGFSASVSITAGGGTVSVPGLALTDVVQTTHSLLGTLGDGSGVIRLETAAGNVVLRALEGSGDPTAAAPAPATP